LYKVILIKLFNLFLAFNVSIKNFKYFVSNGIYDGQIYVGMLYEPFLAEEKFYALLGLSVPTYVGTCTSDVPVPYMPTWPRFKF
jgi:hypothetical protein